MPPEIRPPKPKIGKQKRDAVADISFKVGSGAWI
jgi:hypothetical protein